MQAGRNDSCPCGSGKKYKKCCLNPVVETGDLLWRQLSSIHDDMATRLLEHGVRAFGNGAIEEAWEEFCLWENEIPFAKAFSSENFKIQLFMPFFLYNWTPDVESQVLPTAPEDTTIAADYLKKRGRNFTELERRFLSASVNTPFSFHDVLEVEPGQSFLLKDIFLGTEAKVIERRGSQSAQVGDIVFGKVIQVDHVGMLCGTGWIMIPPAQKQSILDLRKRIRNAPARKGIPLGAETLQACDIELRELFLDLERALSAPPVLHNTDDELLSFHRVVYRIDSPQDAFDRLKDLSLVESEEELLDDAERDPGGALKKATIVWHKRGNAKHSTWGNTVLGRFMIDGERLAIEVNSENRAKLARKEVEKRLKGCATYESTILQSPESKIREMEVNPDPNAEIQRKREQQELMSRPEAQEHVQKMLRAHWDQWFHDKIPALGNKTPLQAAKSADGREMLEALLIDYERNDLRSNLPYKPDYRLIRERLGMKVG